MPNNKAVSKIPHIDICRVCFSAPDLSVRLMELEKKSIEKNFHRTRSLCTSTSSVFFNRSPASTSSDGDDEVFLDNEEDYSVHETNTTPITHPTPQSSCQSIPRFFIASSSFSSVSSCSLIQGGDNSEAHLSSAKRHYTF